MIKEKDIINVKISDEDNFGNGVSRINNFILFVKGTYKNEKVKVKIIKCEKHFAIGELIEVITPSKLRINIPCNCYYKCGGCNYLHVSYAIELNKKQEYLNNLFKDYKVKNIEAFNEYNYRNKIVLHVKKNKIGFYRKNTNDLVEFNYCFLINNNINKLINTLKTFDLSNLTKIMIKETFYTKEILISFYGDILITDLKKIDSYNIKSIYLNDKLIKYSAKINEKIGDLDFSIGNNSFFQVNTICMEKLYNKIKEYALFGDNLLDLYCGTGTIGMYLSANFNNVLGVEVVKESIENALDNKKCNNIKNISFILSDVSKIKNNNISCVVVDPPRSGLNKKVINNLININAKKIVYVSCNPKTLKRDLEYLEINYDVIEITPFNMFPKTKDVETVCLLSRKTGD